MGRPATLIFPALLNDGVQLVGGARDLLLAAGCSLGKSRPVYRAGANQEAADLLKHVRLGQTDQGSFVVTLLTPVVPPPMPALFPDPDDQHAPIERRLTKRLVEALTAARQASERAAAGDDSAFTADTVASGVSANLCEALVRIIEPFPTLDIGVTWARTRPATVPGAIIRFGRTDVALLREAARAFRERAPRPDVRLHGFVRLLRRGETEDDGTIHLATEIDGQRQSVAAVLEQADYERAVQAHKERSLVVVTGDLERTGQRWRLLSPHIEGVLCHDGQESQDA